MFQKAERKKAKLKIGLTGPSGAGKTWSALLMAKGIGGKIALMDTENESASLYADTKGMPEFDTMNLKPPYTVQKYVEAMRGAVAAGYNVLVIDSISHQWKGEGGILNKKEQLDARGGNSFQNWAKLTPEQEQFVASILQTDIHIICTMRSKTEYTLIENDKGKMAPKKVGLAPVQRDGFEYELTTVFDIAMNNECEASKDRTGLWSGKIFKISEETGKIFMKWLEGAKSIEIKPEPVAPVTAVSEYRIRGGKYDRMSIPEFVKAAGGHQAAQDYVFELEQKHPGNKAVAKFLDETMSFISSAGDSLPEDSEEEMPEESPKSTPPSQQSQVPTENMTKNSKVESQVSATPSQTKTSQTSTEEVQAEPSKKDASMTSDTKENPVKTASTKTTGQTKSGTTQDMSTATSEAELDNFVIPIGQKLKGYKLKEIDNKTLKEATDYWRQKQSEGHSSPELVSFLFMADMYLAKEQTQEVKPEAPKKEVSAPSVKPKAQKETAASATAGASTPKASTQTKQKPSSTTTTSDGPKEKEQSETPSPTPKTAKKLAATRAQVAILHEECSSRNISLHDLGEYLTTLGEPSFTSMSFEALNKAKKWIQNGATP